MEPITGNIAPDRSIAIVFRGDRGLELVLEQPKRSVVDCDRLSGRSRIGTEDRASVLLSAVIAIVFRGDRGLEHGAVRDLSGDVTIAIVFRGDRGLEQFDEITAQLFGVHCDRLSGRPRIGTRR